jgi:hypothetical protein
MNTTQSPKKRMTSTLLLLALLGTGLSAGGCAYGGIATAPDGSTIIARNSLFGGLRKIYSCKLAGTAWTCVETTNVP